MEGISVYDSHVKLALWQHIGVITLCVFGIVLNMAMLMIFVAKKQIRGSVYTTYMIQIAITDLLVCVIWLIMSSLYIADLPRMSSDIQTHPGEIELMKLQDARGGTANYAFYRFTFAFYYLHYYFNIFLLATMSVERCVAVWKSLRCQRYEFNRKFIVVVSVAMGVAAIACALPSMLDPNLVMQNEWEEHSVNNISDNKNSIQRKFANYHRCFQPLRVAMERNQSFVMDFEGVSVSHCVDFMTNETLEQLEGGGSDSLKNLDDALLFDDLESMSNLSVQEQMQYFDSAYGIDEKYDLAAYDENYENDAEFSVVYDMVWPEGGANTVKVANRPLYHELLAMAWKLFPTDAVNMSSLCHPMQSQRARVYSIVVNLVIGFFIPFAAIVVSYLYIAYMIGKRAKERLEAEPSTAGEETLGRRMSDFLKQFVTGGGSTSKADGDRTPPYHCGSGSPMLRRSLRQKHKKAEISLTVLIPPEPAADANGATKAETPNTNQSSSIAKTNEPRINGVAQPVVLGASTRPTPATVVPGGPKARLSSLGKAANQRRISGGSASSAESFQTDQTSVHTTSPSPGVRLSQPNFGGHEKAMLKRHSSTDKRSSSSSGTLPGTPQYQQQLGQPRWSGEVFRSNSLDEENKQQTPDPKAAPHEDLESSYDNHETDSLSNKRLHGAPSRGSGGAKLGSSQELWQGSHSRIYTQKPRNFNRQISSTSNYYRARAYSAASKGSTGTGTGGGTMGTSHKTIVHKYAERNMRVSKTVLAYVFVFALCWLPERIFQTLYITEGLVGKDGYFCHAFNAWTRILSFLSVLLNPVMYAITQREVRVYLRKLARRMFKRGAKSKTKRPKKGCNRALINNASENVDFSVVAEHNLTSDDVSRRERHQRNRELWSRMVARLGRKSLRTSFTGSGITGGGVLGDEKQSDGTIDEEKSDEKGQSSKGQSSSNSYKLISNWEDWKQLIDMAGTKNGANPTMGESFL